ncbi:hypothetical protein Acr_23g0000040 [Actinidia rufa]|uniref:Uncharacterized protein n=1 Tax=Actinidia rufa TaxID=165716 RepID=A0A7J0GLB5_9ERIC|nr:hypothetical protein Acr_23g0000040 [Actinidia rufa]
MNSNRAWAWLLSLDSSKWAWTHPDGLDSTERGEIFFFYRPKINEEEAHRPDDVQRLYIVMRPRSSGERQRRTPVEEKQDPRHSATKEAHAKDGSSFLLLLQPSRWTWYPEEYDTSTKGHRCKSPARALGEGIYRILRHSTASGGKITHTHLIYKLEFPPENEKNEPQESFNTKREGSYLIQIKNLDQHAGSSQFRGLQNKRKAVIPAHLQGKFGIFRYCPADPPDFLNYEGCEFLLIWASDDIEEELGLDLKPESCEPVDASCSDLVKTFGETASTIPLFKGAWV